MVFSSLLFLFFFLPVTLVLYFLSLRKLKNTCLFLASLLFYAWGEPVYVSLLLLSMAVDYAVGLGLEKLETGRPQRKLLLVLSIVVNLSVLGFFKYYAFLASNFTALTGIPLPDWDPPLPIGISFYTFQTMSYTVDVYRREIHAQRHFIAFGCYVSLFPQLIAGPIVRYRTIADQWDERKITIDGFADGLRLFLIGLGKKVLLANNIGLLWTEVQGRLAGGEEMSLALAWLGIFAFAMQIYFDFSGYSDMAVGLGRMLGFTFPQNFDYPYIAQSITEFWRRWHISLGTWFREYVYIPLGGNRVGRWRTMRNIFVVWSLTGLWHGASWNFAVWGLYFAVILWMEKWWALDALQRMPRGVRHVYAALLLLCGWVLFTMESVDSLATYTLALLGFDRHTGKLSLWGDGYTLYFLSSYGVILFLCVIGCTPLPKKLAQQLRKRWKSGYDVGVGLACIALLMLSTAYLVDATYNPFLYFRF